MHFGVQIADGARGRARRGIIHRDIKPANLFVSHDDHLKVLDFGLAKLTDHEVGRVLGGGCRLPSADDDRDADVTVTGAAVGTAAYMSPEQATGGKVDARTDLFSFGSVLYEMATGRRAFPGENTGTVIMRLLKGEFIPPRSLNPAIPERLEAIILRAMEVDPEPAVPDRLRHAGGSSLALARAECRTCRPRRCDGRLAEGGAPVATARGPAKGWLVVVAGIALLAIVGGWRWMRTAPGDLP